MTLDEKIVQVLDSADRMFIATSVGANPSAASVFYARDGDDLLFFTFNPTRKAEQIRINPKVQVAIWPRDHNGIRGLQIDGICTRIDDPQQQREARDKILKVTKVFQPYMDDAFLSKNKVTGYYRVRPVMTKYVDFHAEKQFEWREYPQTAPSAFAAMWQALRGFLLVWLRALRAPFFTATLVPVALGGAIAAWQLKLAGLANAWHWPTFWLVMLGALAAHAGTNMANDYGDHITRNDERNKIPSPFSGGSRVIQAGLLAPWQVLAAAVFSFIVAIYIGLRLNAMLAGTAFASTPLLWVGIAGCLLGIAYTLGPYRLSYRGLGEIAVALGFGPIMVLGANYVMMTQAGAAWNWSTPLITSIPIALLVMAIIWINQFQDAPADAASGKYNWVVRLSRLNGEFKFHSALRVYAAMLVGVYCSVLILLVRGLSYPAFVPASVALGLLTLPLAVWAIRRGSSWHQQWLDPGADRTRLPYALLPVNAATVALHLFTGLLLVVAFLL